MVIIDIPMPKECGNCPCSYVIQTGRFEGRLMCNALEYKRLPFEETTDDRVGYCLVKEQQKPKNCPMLAEVRTSNPVKVRA